MTKAKMTAIVDRRKRKDPRTANIERRRGERNIVPNGDVDALMNLRIAVAVVVAAMMATNRTVIPVKRIANIATGNDRNEGDEKEDRLVDDTRRNDEENREEDARKIREVIVVGVDTNPNSKRNDGERERNAAFIDRKKTTISTKNAEDDRRRRTSNGEGKRERFRGKSMQQRAANS